MRIVSWNVNGIRAIYKKGFLDWLNKNGADIVGLQETRARPEQLPEELRSPKGWYTNFVAAKRPGFSGVALFSKRKPDVYEVGLGAQEFDDEGRFQLARFGKMTVANIYFPNGSGKNRDNSRIPFKLAFYRAVFDLFEEQKRNGSRVLLIGDYNTAHREIDLARPKANVLTSGFCQEEREELDRWIREGWIDAFRFYVKEGGHYSWWSNRIGVRERNIGWRIDYVMASPEAMPFVEGAFHEPNIFGSDHCPVGVNVNDNILV